ncbi:MAG: pyridoxal-phosphate dependent enzyme [Brumimicrobium sp.]|nr:pyridoxal-phosphate dependent enzyme [Brumimicrobium sp.]
MHNFSETEMSASHKRIENNIHRTPVLTSNSLNEISGAELYFKCENFQRMGAFKIRGALNAILLLSEDKKKKGVITHSSGNFAQALALAARSLGVKSYIVMPENAPRVKIEAVKGYGGKIIFCPPTQKDREETSHKLVKETGATFIHPSNDKNVILGQGTVAKELLEDYNGLEIIVSPVGGGGLIAGSILAAEYYSNNCKVIGAEPMEADDAYRSLLSGRIETNETTNTLADGLKTNLGNINFPIIKTGIDEIIRVDEKSISEAMKMIWERMKIVVEPSSAIAFAAVLKNPEKFRSKKIGILISGGNVDLSGLPF